MDQIPATVLNDRGPFPPGPYTVEDYHRLARDGFLRREDRVELIEGDLIWMNAVGSRHASVVKRLIRCFAARIGERALLSVRDPVRLDDGSEPEPDVALLVPRADDYSASHPGPKEVLLLVEVAESSLGFDRTRKRALYARHGIAEYWVVNLEENVAEVCRDARTDGYRWSMTFGPDAVLAIAALPGLIVPVREFLP